MCKWREQEYIKCTSLSDVRLRHSTSCRLWAVTIKLNLNCILYRVRRVTANFRRHHVSCTCRDTCGPQQSQQEVRLNEQEVTSPLVCFWRRSRTECSPPSPEQTQSGVNITLIVTRVTSQVYWSVLISDQLTAGSVTQQEKGTPHFSLLRWLPLQLKYTFRSQSSGSCAPQQWFC